MKTSSRIYNETERIAALYQLQILDTEPEEDFDDIVTLASHICQTPVSIISFADGKRSWLKANLGMDFTEISNDIAFYAIDPYKDNLVIINDTLGDLQFSNNPLVKGENGIRFFACVPLINEEGFTLGHLCVMDRQPRTLLPGQLSGLTMLGRQVNNLLKLRLKSIKLIKAEEEVRNSEEQINSIFHNAIDVVIVMNKKGTILQWNPKAESIFGWKAKEVIGKYIYNTIIPERHRDAYFAKMKQFEKPGNESSLHETIEIEALHKQNIDFHIELGISQTTSGGRRFFICSISDITERKSTADKLVEQKKFYENILNNLPIDIAVFDTNHKYLFVNPGAIKNEEYRNFIIGKDDFDYCKYRNRDISLALLRREKFIELKGLDKEIRWEDTVIDPKGTPKTSLRRFFPVHDDTGELSMVLGFGIDISERKVMEEKLTALVKQLSSQNTQLVDFCNIVSHNLRAPLVNMSMLVEFIEESKNETEQKLLIAKLNPVLENLHATFNELVESIQIRQDHEIKSEKIKFKDCLQRTLEGLETEINKSEAEIVSKFDAAPKIYYPAKYLFSIFHNLISNALKYKSPERKPVIIVETKRNNNSIILSVSDNGLGINLEKHKDNIFKIGKVFHRHPNARGFGLFMTKTQVESMDGRIWVESIPDQGTTFFIEFTNQHL